MLLTVVKLLVAIGSLILNIGILRNSYEYLGLLIGTKIPAFHWVINSGLWSLNIMWPVLTLYIMTIRDNKRKYVVADVYNDTNPFYMKALLEKPLILYDGENAKLKDFALLQKIMIIWMIAFESYVIFCWFYPECVVPFVVFLFTAFSFGAAMVKIWMYIRYVKIYKQYFRYMENEEGIWMPFRFMSQRIKLYSEKGKWYFPTQLKDKKMLQNNAEKCGYIYIDSYCRKEYGQTDFYSREKENAIWIYVQVNKDYMKERDLRFLDESFEYYWKKYMTPEKQEKEIYFLAVFVVRCNTRTSDYFTDPGWGIDMDKKRYRIAAVYNTEENRIQISPVYSASKYKEQHEKMNQELRKLAEVKAEL